MTLADLAGWDVERGEAAGGVESYLNALEKQWEKVCEYFGAETEPRRVTAELILSYMAHRRSQGAKDVLRREIQCLKRGLGEAKNRGLIIELPEFPRTKKASAGEKRRGRFHDPAIIVKWLDELPEDARGQALVAYTTGLRAEEVRRIEASWVRETPEGSAVPALLHLPAEHAKNRQAAVIALPREAYDAIKARAKKVTTGKLWPGDHKTAHRLARGRIGYATPISLRDLRHTYGTLLNRLVGIDAARDGLRHSTLATTQYYVSGSDDRMAAGANAIGALLQGNSGQRKKDRGRKKGVRARGEVFETPTFGSGGQHQAALEHLLACNHCLLRVLNCDRLQQIDHEVDRAPRTERGAS